MLEWQKQTSDEAERFKPSILENCEKSVILVWNRHFTAVNIFFSSKIVFSLKSNKNLLGHQNWRNFCLCIKFQNKVKLLVKFSDLFSPTKIAFLNVSYCSPILNTFPHFYSALCQFVSLFIFQTKKTCFISK